MIALLSAHCRTCDRRWVCTTNHRGDPCVFCGSRKVDEAAA